MGDFFLIKKIKSSQRTDYCGLFFYGLKLAAYFALFKGFYCFLEPNFSRIKIVAKPKTINTTAIKS